ncbi:MAG TPA: type II secretion system protein GspC [Gammaproteobacteria bacterium]|nr:type II secretion system protein GspC [Gammaproteobacteria bacterium]
MGEVALVIALAVALADLTWEVAPGPGGGKEAGGWSVAPSSRSGAVSGSSGSSSGGARPGRSLPDPVRDLFGMPPQEDAGKKAQPVRETQLNLTLKGILASREGGQKLALIASGKKKERVYQVGDSVPGGARILRIERRRVILRRNGVTEALNLEVKKLKGMDTSLTTKHSGVGGKVRKSGRNHWVVPRASVQRNLKNLPSLLRQAKAVPQNLNGHRVGFRIVNIQPGSIYEDLGLKEGDVVKSVNGKDIRTPAQALNAYRELKQANNFQVRVKRNGQDRVLTYSVR